MIATEATSDGVADRNVFPLRLTLFPCHGFEALETFAGVIEFESRLLSGGEPGEEIGNQRFVLWQQGGGNRGRQFLHKRLPPRGLP